MVSPGRGSTARLTAWLEKVNSAALMEADRLYVLSALQGKGWPMFEIRKIEMLR